MQPNVGTTTGRVWCLPGVYGMVEKSSVLAKEAPTVVMCSEGSLGHREGDQCQGAWWQLMAQEPHLASSDGC